MCFYFFFFFFGREPTSTVVLKSTCAAGAGFNPAPIVINEQRVVGSRCGPFEAALELLASSSDDVIDVEQYISGMHQNAEELYTGWYCITIRRPLHTFTVQHTLLLIR